MPRLNTYRPLGARLACLAALGLSLGACAADRAVVTGSTYPRDYRERHPIVLGDAPAALDIFVRGPSGLDERQIEDVKAFAEDYRRTGKGGLVAQVPGGGHRDVGTARTLDAVRHALSAGGLPGTYLTVTTYQPADPTLAAPIRLSFRKLQAKVHGKCGLWPQDLGVSDFSFNLRNEPYWNLGCATQTNVAAQVADPVDLVRGRTDGAIDPIRRGQNIEKLRKGNDPSTSYRQDQQNRINQQVAN